MHQRKQKARRRTASRVRLRERTYAQREAKQNNVRWEVGRSRPGPMSSGRSQAFWHSSTSCTATRLLLYRPHRLHIVADRDDGLRTLNSSACPIRRLACLCAEAQNAEVDLHDPENRVKQCQCESQRRVHEMNGKVRAGGSCTRTKIVMRVMT